MLPRASLFLFLILPGILLAETISAPFEALDFNAALQKAAQEKKLLLIDFYTTWCGPCKKLDTDTWPDPTLQTLLKSKVIALKIDAEREAPLAKRFLVNAYPTIAIIRADGSLQDKIVGYLPPKAMQARLEQVFAGKTGVDLAREAAEQAKEQEYSKYVESRYELAKELSSAGKYEEALREYLWCFDEGMVKAKEFTGVRVSFLLSDLRNLMRSYPATKEALEQRRVAAEKAMWESPKATSAASEFAALNKELGFEHENLATFDKLPKGDPRRTRLNVYDALLARKSYEEALEMQPDALFERLFILQEQQAKGQGMAAKHPELRDHAIKACVKKICQRIPALIAVGRRDDAVKLCDRALALDDSAATKAALDAAMAAK